ncbi:MAG: DUF350 domain-containing protein [Planctomycetota bacterium]
MLETIGFGAIAALVLLLLDLGLRQLTRHPDTGTAAQRLLLAARVAAVFLLASTLASACRTGESLQDDVLWATVFGIGGLAAFELALDLGLRPFRGVRAAAREGNLTAATAVAAHTVAIGILVANVFGGRSTAELGLAAASFAVGQVSLVLLLALFRALTSYDDRQQVLDGNLAAALAHGGLAIALALVIAHATDGDYQGPWPAIRDYGLALGEGLLVYPLRQLLVQCVILRARPSLFGGALDVAIGQHRDIGAGALEGGTYLAVALFVTRLA